MWYLDRRASRAALGLASYRTHSLTPHPALCVAITRSTEPLFAAATSAAFLGERLKPTGMLGGLAILTACLVTQMDMAAFASFLPMVRACVRA